MAKPTKARVKAWLKYDVVAIETGLIDSRELASGAIELGCEPEELAAVIESMGYEIITVQPEASPPRPSLLNEAAAFIPWIIIGAIALSVTMCVNSGDPSWLQQCVDDGLTFEACRAAERYVPIEQR